MEPKRRSTTRLMNSLNHQSTMTNMMTGDDTLPHYLCIKVCVFVYGGARCSSVVRAFTHGVMGRRIDPSWGEPIELFLDWCNKGHGMCYPVCGMVHIKEPLLLIGKSSICGGSGFPFSLSEWSLTICLMPYNRK